MRYGAGQRQSSSASRTLPCRTVVASDDIVVVKGCLLPLVICRRRFAPLLYIGMESIWCQLIRRKWEYRYITTYSRYVVNKESNLPEPIIGTVVAASILLECTALYVLFNEYDTVKLLYIYNYVCFSVCSSGLKLGAL